jgi:hypothetical protein
MANQRFTTLTDAIGPSGPRARPVPPGSRPRPSGDRGTDAARPGGTTFVQTRRTIVESQWFALGVAVLLGSGAALQVALIGAMGRERGPAGAALVSLLASVAGLAVVLGLRAARGGPALPVPFDRPVVLAVVALAAGALLAFAVRGLPPYFALTGLPAVAFLVAAGVLGPRLGVGLFLGATIAGQLGGAVVLDHVGAFGAAARHVDAARLAGVGALLLGVVLVRGGR